MKGTVHLTKEELEKRIAHYEYRLQDFIITQEEMEFVQERLRELKSEMLQAFE